MIVKHQLNSHSPLTYYLQISNTVKQLKQSHAFLLKTLPNPHCQHNLSTHLLTRLFNFPLENLSYARQLFDKIPHCKNQFIWTSLIRYHVNCDENTRAVALYARMHSEGVLASGFTFSAVFGGCGRIPRVFEGRQVHARVIQSGFLGNKVVQTAVLDFYAKCGIACDARKVFNEMDASERDVVAWTALICGYTKKGMMEEAKRLFDDMGERNVISWTTMVAGYASKGDMKAAKELYDEMPEKNSVTWVAMIAGYGKCGDMIGAKRVFDSVPVKDPTCCATMLACYAQNGYPKEAVQMFKKLREENVRITEVAMVGTLSACAQLLDVELTDALVECIEDGCCDRTPYVSNALIHLHSKCGNIDQAWREFNRMNHRDVACYSAMITAFADHGMAREALDLFSSMRKEEIEPNQITFVAVLNACSHGGLLEEGFKHFELMTRAYGIEPTAEHLTCMVDLLGRSGQFEKAYHLIMQYSRVSDAGVWGALLKACEVHGNNKLADLAAKRLFELEPADTGNYVLAANTYASMSRWDHAEEVRKAICDRRMRKSPGYSWFQD